MVENQETKPSKSKIKEWLSLPKAQNGLLIGFCVIAVYSIIYADVVSRAKESYQKGEQYLAWHEDPAAKKQHFQDQFQQDKAELDALLKKGDLTEEAYRNRLEALEFDLAFRVDESSLKYAYQWFLDTYELFSPPDSRWAAQARVKAPEVLAMWKDELKSQNIPFEDYMFE